MIDSFWQTAAGITGLGGVATFFVWSLYKDWLKLPIFQRMTKDQQYSLFKLFFVLTFLFGLAALGSYTFLSLRRNNEDKKSVNELATILENRYAHANKLIEDKKSYLKLQIDQIKTTKNEKLSIESNIRKLDEFQSDFLELTKKNLAALRSMNMSLYHEYTKSILIMFSSRTINELFSPSEQVEFQCGGCG